MQIDNFLDNSLIFSLINLGFFGGFFHCTSMCGPFVLTQISNRLNNLKTEEFCGLKKLQNLALLPYHFGRITTYSFIGFLSSTLTKNIREITNFNILSAILLIMASLFFLQKVFEGNNLFQIFVKKAKKPQAVWLYRLRFLTFFPKNFFEYVRFKMGIGINLKKIKFFQIFHNNIIKKLFANPVGINGYFLGIILGFIPCGLLYGAFAIAASMQNPFLAAFAMFLFGIFTIPALFATSFGGYFFFKISNSNFKLIAKLVILINSITLFALAIKLLFF